MTCAQATGVENIDYSLMWIILIYYAKEFTPILNIFKKYVTKIQ